MQIINQVFFWLSMSGAEATDNSASRTSEDLRGTVMLKSIVKPKPIALRKSSLIFSLHANPAC